MGKTNFDNIDERNEMALKPGVYQFITANGTVEYQINNIIGFGGSAITYDVTAKDAPSFHYALKEFYPVDLANNVFRDHCEIVVDEQIENEWNRRKEEFLAEVSVQDRLPQNNSRVGRLFIYSAQHFCANNTAYILYSTE